MANAQGTAIINFGAFPGSNEAFIEVLDQATIGVGSKAESFVMADDATSDHTASDHRYFAALVGLTCGTPIDGVGFTIYARSTEKLQGTFALRWVWAD